MRPAEQGVRLVCRACRQHQHQARRQFHASPYRLDSEQPWWQRMKQTIFPGAEKDKAEEQRSAASKERALADAETDQRAVFKTEDGTVYEFAKQYDPAVNKDYVPADAGHVVVAVGSVKWVKRQADRGEQYEGYWTNKPQVKLDEQQLTRVLHHVAIEALLLQTLNMSLEAINEVPSPGPGETEASHNAWRITQKAAISADSSGALAIHFPNPGDEKSVLSSLGLPLPPSHVLSAGPRLRVDKLPLKDPLVKYAIASRVLHLTDKRIPDAALSRATSLRGILQAYIKPDVPKKLYMTPQVQQIKAELPNVTWHSKRQGLINKEKAVGRWKLIEDELARRNLPAQGTRWKGAKYRLP